MSKVKSSKQIDMTEGTIFPKLVKFAIPLMLSAMLQLLYNAIDMAMVGQFDGTTALSAVGSTTPMVNLFVNMFTGLSMGGSIVASLFFGSKDYENLNKTVHTSILLSIICGMIFGVFGFSVSKQLLVLMDVPDNVLEGSTTYVRIFFSGMIFNSVYNFGSGILRAVGDTKNPLKFLTISGAFNVLFNYVFIVIFGLGVAGVAYGTILSQAISAFLVLRCLCKNEENIRLDFKKLKLHKDIVIKLVKLGVPAGLQGSMFSLSNVIVQSSINSFGSVAMAACVAAGSLEGFMYVGINSVHHACLIFTSQNMGAKDVSRVFRSLFYCLGLASLICVTLSSTALLFDDFFIGLFDKNDYIVPLAKERLRYICIPYISFTIVETLNGFLRGLGYSLTPTLITLCGICGLRLFWIFTVFKQFTSLITVFLTYAFSWTVTAVILLFTTYFICKKIKAENPSPDDRTSADA